MHESPITDYDKMTKAKLVERCDENALKIQKMLYEKSDFLTRVIKIRDICEALEKKHYQSWDRIIISIVVEKIRRVSMGFLDKPSKEEDKE